MDADSLAELIYFFELFADHADLHSFPTRRSSDLPIPVPLGVNASTGLGRVEEGRPGGGAGGETPRLVEDRKSTRLNSSHTVISYAVFCLKKKKTYFRCDLNRVWPTLFVRRC